MSRTSQFVHALNCLGCHTHVHSLALSSVCGLLGPRVLSLRPPPGRPATRMGHGLQNALLIMHSLLLRSALGCQV